MLSPRPYSDIRTFCYQSVYAFTSRYDSTLLGLTFFTPKVFLHKINITVQGQQHFGLALGSQTFAEEYVSKKVTDWVGEISQLSEIAQIHLHAAYCALTYGLIGH